MLFIFDQKLSNKINQSISSTTTTTTATTITIPITTLPLHTWHDGLLAGGALGGVLVGVAFGTQELVFLHGEGLLHQRAAALGTLEALLMPVAVFVGEVLSVSEVSLHFTGGW